MRSRDPVLGALFPDIIAVFRGLASRVVRERRSVVVILRFVDSVES